MMFWARRFRLGFSWRSAMTSKLKPGQPSAQTQLVLAEEWVPAPARALPPITLIRLWRGAAADTAAMARPAPAKRAAETLMGRLMVFCLWIPCVALWGPWNRAAAAALALVPVLLGVAAFALRSGACCAWMDGSQPTAVAALISIPAAAPVAGSGCRPKPFRALAPLPPMAARVNRRMAAAVVADVLSSFAARTS